MNLDEIISQAKAYVWSTQRDNSYWLYAPYLGPSFISQYYLVLNHLDLLNRSKIDVYKLKEILLKTVQYDGGWQQVPDPTRQSNLDSTIFNYWFLKSSQVLSDEEESILLNARKFILRSGGLDACSHMTKIWLCLFGQYDWKKIAYIPLSVFRDDNMFFRCTFVKSWVAQWVYPHVLPIAYLRYFSLNKNLGERFELSELYLEEVVISKIESSNSDSPCFEIKNIIKKLAEMRRPLGSYGAYTVSTLFSMMALKHFAQTYPNHAELEKVYADIQQSFEFVDDIYFNSDSSSYLGVLDDGRWWDTLLITWGLLECDESREKLKPVIKHMFDKGVQKNGGIAYGLEFEYAPDTDDTGVLALILAKYYKNEYTSSLKLTNEWLISMQNSDGGFGAFAQNNYSWGVVRLFAGNFQNSAEIFDASSVDVTAHILEGWAESGYSLSDNHVKRAISYIKAQQTEFGAWEGRWGCNYIYAVSSVISAITKFEDIKLKNEPWLMKSIKWLLSCQNQDGGFGESTLSYTDRNWIGKGVSTPTQTAWAVLVLIECHKARIEIEDCLTRAVGFILNTFNSKGKCWTDPSSVGTGHRQLLYMQYPVYSLAWPLIALGRYKQLKSER